MAGGGSLSWAESVLKIAELCDSFNISAESSKSRCVPLLCCGFRVGTVRPDILQQLVRFSDVFETQPDCSSGHQVVQALRISDRLKTVEERTLAVNKVFEQLREEDVFPCLRGWRNENYAAGEMFSSRNPLFHCERAAARLLGIRQYGVHMNGYFYSEEGEVMMWIGRRSPSKPTYPGMLDNTVAGGIPGGAGVLETLVKECEEEASIAPELAKSARAVGTISYSHEAPDGIEVETEFMYDLELSPDFTPRPLDGEVSQYYLWNMEQIKSEIVLGHFKPNCALVILNFMIRHGHITPDSEPLYEKLSSAAHVNHFV